MPTWYKADERAQEELGMAAKVMGQAKIIIDHWLKSQTLITEADGSTSVEPDWLGQHADDRGTFRQASEIDATLRFRLRALTDEGTPRAVTPAAIISLVQEMLTNEGAAGSFALYEHPRDGAFLIDELIQDTGTGGTFVNFRLLTFGSYTPCVDSDLGKVVVQGANDGILVSFDNAAKTWLVAPGTGTIVAGATSIPAGTGGGISSSVVSGGVGFLPVAEFAYPPVAPPGGRVKQVNIVFTGAASAGNNGTFEVTSLAGNYARFTNGSAVAGVDVSVTWATERLNVFDVVMDGHPYTYLYNPSDVVTNAGIADRAGPGALAGILLMLPIGASTALTAAIAEQLRQVKAAGVLLTVERRSV